MTRATSFLLTTLFLITLFVQSTNTFADGTDTLERPTPNADLERPSPTVTNKPLVTPAAPILNAKAYILIDVNSGKLLLKK